MEITILGSGTSTGVPVVGCGCAVCTSDDPRDKRTRSSVWLKSRGLSILFDTATEFRLQALRAGLSRVDAVFLTHAHADHVHGIDDLRPLSHHDPIRVYGDDQTLREVESRFSYIFSHGPVGGGKPHLLLERIGSAVRLPGRADTGGSRGAAEETGHGSAGASGESAASGGLGADSGTRPAEAAGGESSSVEVVPVPVYHGTQPILGFRVGPFAYLTDCSEIPEASYALLRGVEVVVIDALRFRSHPTHFNVEEAVEAVRRMGAGTAYLTHLCHDVGYAELERALPEGIHPAHDGLVHSLSHPE